MTINFFNLPNKNLIEKIKEPMFFINTNVRYRPVSVADINGDSLDDIKLVISYMGNGIGRWDGDTLVVDSIGFNDKTWLAGTGTFHSDKLHVVEKFTRKDENTIAYEVTMEDPVVLTKPWILQSTLMLRPGTRLREYECVENNTDLDRYEKLLKDESVFRRK